MDINNIALRYKLAIPFLVLILTGYLLETFSPLGHLEIVAVLAVIAGAAIFLLDRSVVPALRQVAEALTALGSGGVFADIPGGDREDEIGNVIRAFRAAKSVAEHHVIAERREIARRDMDAERRIALVSMVETVEKSVSAAAVEVAARTDEMASTVSEMARSVQAVEGECDVLVGIANESVLSSQTVASATEQLAASIREISSQVGNSARISRDAVDASTTTRATIDALRTAVRRIANVAKLIGDIAAQTNLLALNATIEAARAGDAGKGFAVVAGEVKSLANQTARSTEEITREVEAVRSATESAVVAVDNINARISELDQISTAVAEAMEQQSIATQEIARTINQSAKSAQQVSTYVNVVSTETGATGKRAEHLNTIANQVVTGVEKMRQSIINSLRTTTKEANRRNNDRVEVGWQAELVVDGRSVTVDIEDLSEGGAKIKLPTPLGSLSKGILRVAELPGDLPFRVTKKTDTCVHLSFELTPEISARLKRRLDSRAHDSAA